MRVTIRAPVGSSRGRHASRDQRPRFPIPLQTAPDPWKILWTHVVDWVGRRWGHAGVLLVAVLVLLAPLVCARYHSRPAGAAKPSTSLDLPVPVKDGGLASRVRSLVSSSDGSHESDAKVVILSPLDRIVVPKDGGAIPVRGEAHLLSARSLRARPYVMVVLQQESTGIHLTQSGLICPDGSWRVFLDSNPRLEPGSAILSVLVYSGTGVRPTGISRKLSITMED